jgi:CelD/BcsL family acetyltransferase involved in cellulose biosynthesis
VSPSIVDCYLATVDTNPASAIARWHEWIAAGDLAAGLFQTPRWLTAWYATLGAQPDRQPLFASIVRRGDGRPLMALPLLLHRRGGLRRIEFADLGVTDYVAPLLASDCPDDPEHVRAMFAALRRALPTADVFCAHKMPALVNGRPNPLLRLRGTRPSSLFGNLVTVDGDFDAWRYSREKTHRKELERSWRVFTRHPNAEFRLITDVAEATRIMDALETYQRSAIANKGWAYILDEPGYRDFYRRLIVDGLASGDTVLSALTAGDEVIGALLGIRRGHHYAMIRIGNAGGEWRNCSPGRLVIERTMAALHAQDVRDFDFTIGDYPYKKGFRPEELPLYELTAALSWKGMPHAAFLKLKHELKLRLKNRLPTQAAESPALPVKHTGS